jgi:hypothetical protein
MPAKRQPSSRAALVVVLLVSVVAPWTERPATLRGFQPAQASALDRALRAGDLDEARRLIPNDWAASEQLFVSYLERAFLPPGALQPASEPRLLASRLADVFFRMVEYDFARSVIAALNTADTTRCQALIETVRDYYAALERVRANSIVLTLTPGLPPQQQRDESESRQLATRRLASQLAQVADRFRSLACPRCELHTLRSMINTGGEPRPRVDEVAAQLGDDLSLARKRPYTEASLALAERLGLPRTECAVLESLGILPSTVTDPAKLQQAARHLERGRSLLQSVPAREQVNYWLFTSLAPRLSTVVLPELWRLYHRLGRSSEALRQLLAEALELSRPFGERAVMATLNSFASRAVNIGGDAGEPILEASRAFGPKAELATMRTLSGSYSTRTFRPDVAERPL